MPDLPATVGSWSVVRELGQGGQGTVYLVRSPTRADELKRAIEGANLALRSGAKTVTESDERTAYATSLLESAAAYSRPDQPEELGAGKVYKIPPGPHTDKTIARLAVEFEVLRSTSSPHIVRLLHSDLESRLMVTEFHPHGTLLDNAPRFVGRPIEALEAFRGLVEAVSMLHVGRIIHRDIKSANVFVAGDGRLVLGDFGIVFVEGDNVDRLTDTFERVGTRDWMPPWAHTGTRIDDVRPSFDVFSLGKLLWSMVDGRRFLPFWWWNKLQFDLTRKFSDVPSMEVINQRILAATVVDSEDKCLSSASELLRRVDEVLGTIRAGGGVIGKNTIPCRICDRGKYEPWFQDKNRLLALSERPNNRQIMISNFAEFLDPHNTMNVRVMQCENCGHIELFHFKDGNTPPAWRT